MLWKLGSDRENMYDEFLLYKTRIPVRGAILLDPSLKKVYLFYVVCYLLNLVCFGSSLEG